MILFHSALRVLRGFRPFRLVSRNRGLRLVIEALTRSLFAILNVCAVVMILWSIFAVLGIHLWYGQLKYCSNPEFPAFAELDGVRASDGSFVQLPCSATNFTDSDGVFQQAEVLNPELNFDHFGNVRNRSASPRLCGSDGMQSAALALMGGFHFHS